MKEFLRRLDSYRVYLIVIGLLILALAALIAKTKYDLVRLQDGLSALLMKNGKVDKVARLCTIVQQKQKIVDDDKMSAQGEGDTALTGYLTEKARAHGITAGQDFFVSKGRTDSPNAFYSQSIWTLQFKSEVDRKKLVSFLYDVERNAPRLRITRIRLPDVGKPEDRSDRWKPEIELTYRARKAGATS